MNKFFLLCLFFLLFAGVENQVFAADTAGATKFQQYEQQSPQYGNPPGYMLPPVVYGMPPYGCGVNYGYNQNFVNNANYDAYSNYSNTYVTIPYVWFNPVDFAGDDYYNANRKSTSTLVKPGEYTINNKGN